MMAIVFLVGKLLSGFSQGQGAAMTSAAGGRDQEQALDLDSLLETYERRPGAEGILFQPDWHGAGTSRPDRVWISPLRSGPSTKPCSCSEPRRMRRGRLALATAPAAAASIACSTPGNLINLLPQEPHHGPRPSTPNHYRTDDARRRPDRRLAPRSHGQYGPSLDRLRHDHQSRRPSSHQLPCRQSPCDGHASARSGFPGHRHHRTFG